MFKTQPHTWWISLEFKLTLNSWFHVYFRMYTVSIIYIMYDWLFGFSLFLLVLELLEWSFCCALYVYSKRYIQICGSPFFFFFFFFATWYEMPYGIGNLVIQHYEELIWLKWKTTKTYGCAINWSFPTLSYLSFSSLHKWTEEWRMNWKCQRRYWRWVLFVIDNYIILSWNIWAP